MKGIILAGGKGTRLYPATWACSKQILPVYDKPMIYYPLSILMLAGIRDILIISTPRDVPMFKELLSNGNELGINIEYKIQEAPKVIAEAFILGEDFIGNDSVCLILGDNLFYGNGLSKLVQSCSNLMNGAILFGYKVNNPSDYGVAEVDENLNVLNIEEKPKNPKSDIAVTGLYFYDNSVVKKAKEIKPSARGELEITAINNLYVQEKNVKLKILSRGYAWLDTGSNKNLLNASNFIEMVQERQGQYIACLEEIAYRMGYINKAKFVELGNRFKVSDYGRYILKLAEEIWKF